MDGLQVVVGQQVEGAEDLVVLEVEGAGGVKGHLEGHGPLGGLLFCLSLQAQGSGVLVVMVVMGSGSPGGPPRPPGMVLVGLVVEMRRVVLGAVAIEIRHAVREPLLRSPSEDARERV